MRMLGGWRAGGVGKRSTAAAVLVAAGIAVTTTGVASAGEPDAERPDEVVVTCVDGEPIVREPTQGERESFRAERVPDGWVEVETHTLPEGGVVGVVPAEPGELPPAVCDAVVPPGAGWVEPAVAARPR
jgi:hypothetical protein